MMTEYIDGHERIKSSSYQNPDDGIHLCSYCHLQLGEGSVECINCALAEFEDERVEWKKGGYYELIMAVVNKHEGESRHDTALRYIKERENQEGRVATSNALKEVDDE